MGHPALWRCGFRQLRRWTWKLWHILRSECGSASSRSICGRESFGNPGESGRRTKVALGAVYGQVGEREAARRSSGSCVGWRNKQIVPRRLSRDGEANAPLYALHRWGIRSRCGPLWHGGVHRLLPLRTGRIHCVEVETMTAGGEAHRGAQGGAAVGAVFFYAIHPDFHAGDGASHRC
jgi:hypothetical protein